MAKYIQVVDVALVKDLADFPYRRLHLCVVVNLAAGLPLEFDRQFHQTWFVRTSGLLAHTHLLMLEALTRQLLLQPQVTRFGWLCLLPARLALDCWLNLLLARLPWGASGCPVGGLVGFGLPGVLELEPKLVDQ